MCSKRFTVFTATYNRLYRIHQLYMSLANQTFRDFEWIVIDDGSTDDTQGFFSRLLTEQHDFPIHYERVQNGGKHRAINRGMTLAEGELFFIVDSDDCLQPNSLEVIDRVEKTIPIEKRAHFAGVCGLKAYKNMIPVGSTFWGKEYLDITSLERTKYLIMGDKAEVFYTAVLKQFPFPEFEGEKFLTECVVWDRIASAGYLLRFFNEIVYICEYLDDGLSANSSLCFQKAPKGTALFVRQSIELNKITGIEKWKERRNYYNMFKKEMTLREIAELLDISPISLLAHSFGLRVFYRLYR